MLINLSRDNFEKEVLQSQTPVLVDFWADWCAPCKRLAPVVEKFATDHPDIKVCKLNIDEEEELAIKYKVMSIPTLIVFRNGEVVKKSVGFVTIEEIQALF